MTDQPLKDAAYATPDPDRALRNIESFLDENPEMEGRLRANLRDVSMLFSNSQFLANYCISNPDVLFERLKTLDTPPDRDALLGSLKLKIDGAAQAPGRPSRPELDVYMGPVRRFRVEEVLSITLRDILGRADLVDTLSELTMLADVILDVSVGLIRGHMSEIYGIPADDAFSVIALGKMGAGELNFSSDIDLMYVYGEEGETSGVRSSQGVIRNRISSHEYYCKVGEALGRFLSLNTEDGFAYRVDLRLRPEGQRGAIAQSLRGYEVYYESWGRAWERAMLIRARPVAGDQTLGRDFIEMIRPFVYRKYLDFSAIDEIKALKTRIDSQFKKGDIKRGYGGIREIEFFTQALQLIYGGREPLLRERSTLKALHMLMQKALVGQEDFSVLSDNYGRLRVLEHRLQQLNDLQTHTLPSGGRDLDILGRKLGFADAAGFMSDLEQRRASVRRIYDSLFGEEAKKTEGETGFFDEELSDTELREHLSTTGLKDINRAVRNIREIKDSSLTFQTLKGRRLLSGILPLFVDSALKTGAPDEALSQLQSFAKLLGANESYLEIFSRDRRMIDMLTAVFAQTAYLSRFLISRPQYLEMIGWQERPDKTLSKIKDEISAIMSEGRSVNEAVRFIKQAEEVRLGLLFLQGELPVGNVTRGLSRVAHAVLSVCLGHLRPDVGGLAIIGLGKLGGREITFGSDLDIVFISGDGVGTEDTLAAERLLRILTSYTKDGMAYKIDTRLRPEGSKGPLVSSIDGFRSYYLQSALFWELQALLKARPVAGSEKAGLAFMSMAHEVLMTRGREVMASDIRRMRERIMRELSKEAMGYDIKLSSGGLEELEFIIQFLQLRHCRQHPSILVQNTLKAIDRLRKTAIVSALDAEDMRRAYIFYRTVESLLRLRGEDVLRRDETSLKNMAGLLGAGGPEELISMIDKSRQGVTEAGERYLRDP